MLVPKLPSKSKKRPKLPVTFEASMKNPIKRTLQLAFNPLLPARQNADHQKGKI